MISKWFFFIWKCFHFTFKLKWQVHWNSSKGWHLIFKEVYWDLKIFYYCLTESLIYFICIFPFNLICFLFLVSIKIYYHVCSFTKIHTICFFLTFLGFFWVFHLRDTSLFSSLLKYCQPFLLLMSTVHLFISSFLKQN